METLGDRLKKTAGEVVDLITEAAHKAGERLGEMNELQRLNGQLRALKRERDQCRLTMADLLIRMFDQSTFAEALLRPEYTRIKEIDVAMAALEAERADVTERMRAGAQPASAPGAVPAPDVLNDDTIPQPQAVPPPPEPME